MSPRQRPRTAAALIACAATTLMLGVGAGTATAAPQVNMERVLIAAQLDEYRPGNATTKGAVKSVKRIQRALRRHDIAVAVDGNFGGQTSAAYARWQRSLGYSGLDASGMPGLTSLQRLGLSVNHVVSAGERRSYSGVTLDTRTIRMVKAAGKLLGPNCVFDVTKGSYTGPDSSSAATHAGGGALDLSVRDGARCGRTAPKMRNAMKRVGFAAWWRHTGSYVNNKHIHAVAISDPDMATEIAFPGNFDMREQIVAWAQKKDGLSAATAGPMVRGGLQTWERFKRSR